MTYKEIINWLIQAKITVLAGAGISYDSGLPIVSAFYQHFLPMFYEKEDVEKLTHIIQYEHIPFERMMEHIFSYTGNDYAIMDIFANGEPNTIHGILAKMFADGWASELYTTNFDCLIEKSLDKFGLTKQKDYGYYFEEKGFSKFTKTHSNKNNLIKIHGTIDQKDTIRTTLEKITSSSLLSSRKPAIERLFSTGNHDVVLVIGYSFSDVFDINKYIKELNVSKKIIIINHTKENNITISPLNSLNDSNDKNPFLKKNIEGLIVNANTLSILSELYLAKYGIIPNVVFQKYDWKSYLYNWGTKFDRSHRNYIAGGICNSMNEFNIGEKYIRQAFEEIGSNKIDLYISVINHYALSRFRTRKDQKECNNLISLCKKAIQLLEENKHDLPEDFYVKRLDDLTYRIGRIYEDGLFDYKKALRQYFSAYRIEYRYNDILEMSKTLHEIGRTYASIDNITTAIKCFNKSIKLKRKCGYIGGITRTYYTMAAEILKANRNKLKQAENYLRKAEENANIVGEIDLAFYIHNLQGTILMEKQEWEKASEIFDNNLYSLKNQPHKDILATASYNLARCEIRLKKYHNAINRLEMNSKRIFDWGMNQRIFRNNQELAFAYLLSDNPEKCYHYLSENATSLSLATNADKAHFFFYIALYYKKYDLKKYCGIFLNLSKHYFKENDIIRDFFSLKKYFYEEIISDKTLELSENKYLLQEVINEFDKTQE